jgi:hypothetical protein
VNVVARAPFAPVHITLSLVRGEQKRYNLSPEVLANVADNLSKVDWSRGLCLIRGCREETGQRTARDQELHGDLTWRGGQ